MTADEQKKIERLERKVRRERSAREQAEQIAEDGMRRLFLANQDSTTVSPGEPPSSTKSERWQRARLPNGPSS